METNIYIKKPNKTLLVVNRWQSLHMADALLNADFKQSEKLIWIIWVYSADTLNQSNRVIQENEYLES